MILKTITIKNFRKFKNTTIDFPDGVTGVVGLNGAGKSTIFEAIAWVLYGPVAARTSSDQIKRQDSNATESCRVELDFIFEEENYRIVREMTGKNLSPSATATINGKIAATSAETVSKFIQKKLGMDFKSFYTSIFAKQKELNALSSMNASERRPLILKMLGIDSLDEIIKDIKSDKRNKEVLINKLNQDLFDSDGKNQINSYKIEINVLNKYKNEINFKIINFRKDIKNLKNELKLIEKKLGENKRKYEKLNIKKEQIIEKKINFEKKQKLVSDIVEIKEKINQRKYELEKNIKKSKEFYGLELNIDKIDTRLNKLDKEIEKIIIKIEQNKILIDKFNEDIISIETKIKKIQDIGPKAKCPICERILLDQYQILLKKFDDDKTKKDKEIKLFLKENISKEQSKERINREKQAVQKKKNYFQNKLKEKEITNTTIKHISNEIKKEKLELEEKDKKLNLIEEIDFDLNELKIVKKQVTESYQIYQESLELHNNKKDELNNNKILMAKQDGEKKLLDQEIKNLKNNITKLEKIKRQMTEDTNAAKFLKILYNIMEDFRIHLISRIRPTLSEYSSDFFRRLTDGKYVEMELDKNYDLFIFDNGESYKIERFSGGEEDLANLCLRLAISEVITERASGVFNFIILDEIFGSQDNIRRQNIINALNGLSSKFRQIFLITHVEDVKNDMENIIYVDENEKGISMVRIE